MTSKMRSAPARADCMLLYMLAKWRRGLANCLLYWMKVAMVPTVAKPCRVIQPPRPATMAMLALLRMPIMGGTIMA